MIKTLLVITALQGGDSTDRYTVAIRNVCPTQELLAQVVNFPYDYPIAKFNY